MAEPISLTEAKAQVRMNNDDTQDTFITSLIAPARALVERRSGYSFVAGTRVFQFTRWGDFLEIYLRPISSVTSVEYVDEEGADATYEDYLAPLGAYPFRIFPAVNDEFPTIADGTTITVTLAADAVDSTSQEYLIGKRAMLLALGFWFDNRGEVPLSKEVQLALDSLLAEITPIPAY